MKLIGEFLKLVYANSTYLSFIADPILKELAFPIKISNKMKRYNVHFINYHSIFTCLKMSLAEFSKLFPGYDWVEHANNHIDNQV